MIQDGRNDPRQESEHELKESAINTLGGVNHSGTAPVIETDEEHAAGASNVRTNRMQGDEKHPSDMPRRKDAGNGNDITM